MAAVLTPADADDWYKWLQSDKGPGDDFVEFLDAELKAAKGVQPPAKYNIGMQQQLWALVEEHDSVCVDDLTIGDIVYSRSTTLLYAIAGRAGNYMPSAN